MKTLLEKSPKSFYEESFIKDDELFTELNKVDGWQVNKYKDYPLNI